MADASAKQVLFEPIFSNNPIALQILGICSALAVTTSMNVTLVMCAAVIAVTAFSNLAVSWYAPRFRAVSGSSCR